MYTLFASQFPFTHIFKTSSFFFYLKFCFGTVVKNIVKLDLKKIKRYDAVFKIKLKSSFFQLAAILLLIFSHTVVFLFQFKRIG